MGENMVEGETREEAEHWARFVGRGGPQPHVAT